MLRRVAAALRRVFIPLCRGNCRQPVHRCNCSWLPPLPDELDD